MVKALSFLRREAERHVNHQGMAVVQTTDSFDGRALYNSLAGNASVGSAKKGSKKKKNASEENMILGEVIKAQFGPAVGTHAGPGAVGVAFIGDPPK